jgi:hypothetical protein
MLTTAYAPPKPTTTPFTNPTRRATTARLFSFNSYLPDALVHYAPECVEGEFSEVGLPLYCVLGKQLCLATPMWGKIHYRNTPPDDAPFTNYVRRLQLLPASDPFQSHSLSAKCECGGYSGPPYSSKPTLLRQP